MNTIYDTLPEEGRILLDEALDRFALCYDEETGFVTDTTEDPPCPDLRLSMYYALGLLIKQGKEAVGAAERIIRSVIACQFTDPDEIYFGAFRHPNDPMPPSFPGTEKQISPSLRYRADLAWEKTEEVFRALLEKEGMAEQEGRVCSLLREARNSVIPVVWDTYEPNLREFIGITFAMLLEHFDGLLSKETVKNVEESARLLCKGAEDRVRLGLTPLNTNVRIMYVFVLDWFSCRFRDEGMKKEALQEAEKLLSEYRELHACAEYNSPTYYGVDLTSLGFWRRYGSSARLKALGKEMEEGIWRDFALLYNPSLRNLCGPYSRAYEPDLSKHTCFYDIFFLCLGRERFPYHPFTTESGIIPLTLLGDVRVPEDVLPLLLEPAREKSITRSFRELSERGEPGNNAALCTLTAFMTGDLMLGALSGSRNTSDQLRPFVLFWRAPDGSVSSCVLRRRYPDGSSEHVHYVFFDGHTEKYKTVLHAENRTGRDEQLVFEFNANGASPAGISENLWRLPGLTVQVTSSVPLAGTEQSGSLLRVLYPLNAGQEANIRLIASNESKPPAKPVVCTTPSRR